MRLALRDLEEGVVHRPQHARQHARHAIGPGLAPPPAPPRAPPDTPAAAASTLGSRRTLCVSLGAGGGPRTGQLGLASELRGQRVRGELCSLDAAVAVPNAVEAGGREEGSI